MPPDQPPGQVLAVPISAPGMGAALLPSAVRGGWHMGTEAAAVLGSQ